MSQPPIAIHYLLISFVILTFLREYNVSSSISRGLSEWQLYNKKVKSDSAKLLDKVADFNKTKDTQYMGGLLVRVNREPA